MKKDSILTYLVMVFFIGLIPAKSQEALLQNNKPAIVLIPIKIDGRSETEARVLNGIVRAKLSESFSVFMDAKARKASQKFYESGLCPDLSCLEQVGVDLEVKLFGQGDIQFENESVIFSYQIVDVFSGAYVASAAGTCVSCDNVELSSFIRNKIGAMNFTKFGTEVVLRPYEEKKKGGIGWRGLTIGGGLLAALAGSGGDEEAPAGSGGDEEAPAGSGGDEEAPAGSGGDEEAPAEEGGQRFYGKDVASVEYLTVDGSNNVQSISVDADGGTANVNFDGNDLSNGDLSAALAWYSDGGDLSEGSFVGAENPFDQGAIWGTLNYSGHPTAPTNGLRVAATGLYVANDFIGNDTSWSSASTGAYAATWNYSNSAILTNADGGWSWFDGLDFSDSPDANNSTADKNIGGTVFRFLDINLADDTTDNGYSVTQSLLRIDGSYEHVIGLVLDRTATTQENAQADNLIDNDPTMAFGVIGFSDNRYIPHHGSATYVGEYFGVSGTEAEVRTDGLVWGSIKDSKHLAGEITLDLTFSASPSSSPGGGTVDTVSGSMTGSIQGSFDNNGASPLNGEQAHFWARMADPTISGNATQVDLILTGRVFGPRAKEIGGVFASENPVNFGANNTQVGGFFRASRSGQACTGDWCE